MEKEILRLKGKYGYSIKAEVYIDTLQQDITENIDAFMDYENQDEKYDESFFKRYFVNVVICNRDLEGAPVIYQTGVVSDEENVPVDYFKSIARSEYIRFASVLVR
jgi:hypothetical protein